MKLDMFFYCLLSGITDMSDRNYRQSPLQLKLFRCRSTQIGPKIESQCLRHSSLCTPFAKVLRKEGQHMSNHLL